MKREVIETTLGELVAALTEEAFLVAHNEREANELVADMLSDLLAKAETPKTRWH